MSRVKTPAWRPNFESLAISSASLEGGVAIDRRHRAEDLLAPDLRLVRRRAEQGRGQAAALVDQLAAGEQLGAGGDRLVDPLLDPVAVARGDQRPDVGLVVERVADLELLDVGDQPLGEGVGDVLLDEDALDRDAALAGVREGVDLRFVGRRLPVAVGVDDQRRVGAQLEVDLLVGDAAADAPADLGRAGEGSAPRSARARRSRCRPRRRGRG